MRRPLKIALFSPLGGVILLGVIGACFYPWQVEVAPAWTVQVLDATGKPLPGIEVSQIWSFFNIRLVAEGRNSRLTDAQGRVVFPRHSIGASKGGLIAGKFLSSVLVHSSFGPAASVCISPQGYKRVWSHYYGNGKLQDDPGAQTTMESNAFATSLRVLPLDFFDLAYNRDWAAMKLALAADPASPKLRDRFGATPLILLSSFEMDGPNAEIIGLLIAAGAEINARANDGTTALHNAAKNYDVAYMELLLAKGADPKLRIKDSVYYTTNGFTPLHFLLGAYDNIGPKETPAAQKIKGIELLLAHGADINAPDDSGDTPLHLAAAWGDPEIVAALLGKGANANARNSSGQTPLASIRGLHDTPPVLKVRELLASHSEQKPAAQP